MKLIELLARELKKWPEGWVAAAQDVDGQVAGFTTSDLIYTDDQGWSVDTGENGAYIGLSRQILGQWLIAEDYYTAVVTHEQWEDATNQPFESIPGTTATPTLETMLAEWRDLEARAQAVQAEADALFEHAGQCHGEIVVRLAELGWGAPRGKPVVTLDTPLDMTDWRNWQVGDIVKRVRADHDSMMSVGDEGPIVEITDHPTNPFRVDLFYVPNVADLDWISRPSTQP